MTAGYYTDIDTKLKQIKKIQAVIYFHLILWLKDHFDALKATAELDDKRAHKLTKIPPWSSVAKDKKIL